MCAWISRHAHNVLTLDTRLILFQPAPATPQLLVTARMTCKRTTNNANSRANRSDTSLLATQTIPIYHRLPPLASGH
jgi:hypothetical protein